MFRRDEPITTLRPPQLRDVAGRASATFRQHAQALANANVDLLAETVALLATQTTNQITRSHGIDGRCGQPGRTGHNCVNSRRSSATFSRLERDYRLHAWPALVRGSPTCPGRPQRP
jgi:hypothetical protein